MYVFSVQDTQWIQDLAATSLWMKMMIHIKIIKKKIILKFFYSTWYKENLFQFLIDKFLFEYNSLILLDSQYVMNTFLVGIYLIRKNLLVRAKVQITLECFKKYM